MREPLCKNTEIILYNSKGEQRRYVILDIFSTDGQSCICYNARRIIKEYDSHRYFGKKRNESDYKDVLLKEFYPNYQYIGEKDIVRNEDGALELNLDGNDKLREAYDNYISNIVKLGEFANDNQLCDYVCADKDVEPLFTSMENGTVYFENMYYPMSSIWIDDKADDDVKLSQVIQSAISVMNFLEIFHDRFNLGYVDLKPEDTLIRCDEFGNINHSKTLFFDFDSSKELNKRYMATEIQSTKTYEPSYFERRVAGIELLINRATENCMFMNVLNVMIEEKTDKEIVNEDVDLNKNIIKYEKDKEAMSEREIIQKLSEIKRTLDDNECNNFGKKYKKDKIKYSVFKVTLCMLLMMMYGVFAYLSIKTSFSNEQDWKQVLMVDLILLGLLVVISVLKVANYVFADRIAKIQVSHKYYNKKDSNGNLIRNMDYNTFREGKSRKKTTFQDYSDANQSQQHLRHILWVVLACSLVAGVFISIIVNSLAIFFAIGFIELIVFMLTEYILASRRGYIRYARFKANIEEFFYSNHNISEKDIDNHKIAKAIYYEDEYLETMDFDINKTYYSEGWRNLFVLRERTLDEGYSISKSERIPSKLNYDSRLEFFEKRKKEDLPYNFADIQIKQIYKMAFDRLKNRQLVFNIVISILSLLVIVLTLVRKFQVITDFVGIPLNAYLPITIVFDTSVIVISIIQVLYASREEKEIAEMSYKSNFVKDDSLNEVLQNDIAAGYIKKIDIARGTTQYEGYIVSRDAGEKTYERKSKIREFLRKERKKHKNRPMLYYRQITNRNRIAITIWCLFGSVCSLVVWNFKMYWAVVPLVTVTIILHIFIRNVVLPVYSINKVIKEIKRIVKQKNEEENDKSF